MNTNIRGRDWSLSVQQEGVWFDSFGPEPDPDWTYVDHAGHEHTAARTLLVEVQDDPDDPPFMFDADGEEYNAPTHIECELCGEWIRPGTRMPLGPRWIATTRQAEVEIYAGGQLQRWQVWDDSLVTQIAANPDATGSDIALLVQQAGNDKAFLTEFRSVYP